MKKLILCAVLAISSVAAHADSVPGAICTFVNDEGQKEARKQYVQGIETIFNHVATVDTFYDGQSVGSWVLEQNRGYISSGSTIRCEQINFVRLYTDREIEDFKEASK